MQIFSCFCLVFVCTSSTCFVTLQQQQQLSAAAARTKRTHNPLIVVFSYGAHENVGEEIEKRQSKKTSAGSETAKEKIVFFLFLRCSLGACTGNTVLLLWSQHIHTHSARRFMYYTTFIRSSYFIYEFYNVRSKCIAQRCINIGSARQRKMKRKKNNENGNQNKRNERNMRCFKNEKQIKFDEFYV